MERILCSGLQAERAEQSWQQKGRELGQYPNWLLPELHSLFILSVVYAFLIHLLIPSGCTTLHSVNMNKTTLWTGQWQLGKPWNVSRGRSFNRPSAKGWLWWRQAVAGNRSYLLALCCHCVRFGQWTWDGVFLVLKGENITVQRMCSVRSWFPRKNQDFFTQHAGLIINTDPRRPGGSLSGWDDSSLRSAPGSLRMTTARTLPKFTVLWYRTFCCAASRKYGIFVFCY